MKISSRGLRLYLRGIEASDANEIARHLNDYDIASMIPNTPSPYGMEHAALFVEFAERRLAENADFHMAVVFNDGTFIGMCAIANIDKINMNAELGYWIAKDYWGNGYAKEAIRIILSFAFNELRLNRIYAKVLTRNERSIHLLESLGFSNEGTSKEEVFHTGKFLDVIRFGIIRKDYTDHLGIEIER